MKNVDQSPTKGRCRSTAYTAGGFHTNGQIMRIMCVWPGTTDTLKVRRNDRGEIVALDPLGEPFVLQHVKDAAALKRLFAEQGVDWDGEGVWVTDRLARALERDDRKVLLDENMLSGNYPESMSNTVKKRIGRLMGEYAKTPGITKKDLRRVRAKLIHETWLNGNQPLDDEEARRILERFCPTVAICGLDRRHLALLEKLWDNPSTEGVAAADAILRKEVVAEGINEELFFVQHGLKRELAAVSMVLKLRFQENRPSFSEFMQVGMRLEEKPGEGREKTPYRTARSYRRPDGGQTNVIDLQLEFSSMSNAMTAKMLVETDTMWNSCLYIMEGVKPKVQKNGDLWCHTCQGECRCPKGRGAIKLMNGWLNGTRADTEEHRWGHNHQVKATKRLQEQAKQLEEDTAARLASLLGEEDWHQLNETAGEGLAGDVALMLVQMGANPEDMDQEYVLGLKKELEGVKTRSTTWHAGWARRIQELEILGSDTPKTAVFLGRDGIYGYWAFQELEKLGAVDTDKIQAVYVSASRWANPQSLKKVKKLSEDGRGADLVYVDTGFMGTIPNRIASEVFEQNVPDVYQREDPDHGLKRPYMRLMASSRGDKRFAYSISQDDAINVEHDAKNNMSGKAVVIGKDGGAPTSALEQFITRRLKVTIQQQARKEAETLERPSSQQVAETYYTTDCVRTLHEVGIGYEQIAESGRLGLAVEEVKNLYETKVPVAYEHTSDEQSTADMLAHV